MIHWNNMCMLKETKCDAVEIRNKYQKLPQLLQMHSTISVLPIFILMGTFLLLFWRIFLLLSSCRQNMMYRKIGSLHFLNVGNIFMTV